MNHEKNHKIIFLFVYVFVFTSITGCGKAHFQTIKEPVGILKYNEIYVANTEVSSDEHNQKLEVLNTEFSLLSLDEIVKALSRKRKYRIIENVSSSSNSLIIETTIHIVYGSRALRYWFGMFGAGKGSVVINMKLKESFSREIKFEMESYNDLVGGWWGGSMDRLIKNSIKKIVKKFVAKL